jgi:hypothetical protein
VLTFQQRLQDGIQKNNLTTIFDVRDIPKDTQMRSVLDAIFTSELDGIFADFLHRLQRGKHLANYRFFDGSYLLSIDGSQYFSSEKICCPHCLVTASKDHVRYHHQILQSVTLASKCKLSLINPHFGYRCTNGHGGVRPHSGCRFNNLANAIDRGLSVAISLCIFWQLSSLQCKIGTFIAL